MERFVARNNSIFDKDGTMVLVARQVRELSGVENVAEAMNGAGEVAMRPTHSRTGELGYFVSVDGAVQVLVNADHPDYWKQAGIPFTEVGDA